MENKTKELQDKEKELKAAHEEEEAIIAKLDEEKAYHDELVRQIKEL